MQLMFYVGLSDAVKVMHVHEFSVSMLIVWVQSDNQERGKILLFNKLGCFSHSGERKDFL